MSDTHAFVPCTIVAVLLHKLGHDGKSMPSIALMTKLYTLTKTVSEQVPEFKEAVYIADGGITTWAFTVKDLKADGLGAHLGADVPLEEVRILGHKDYIKVREFVDAGKQCHGMHLHWNNKHRRHGPAMNLCNTLVQALATLYPSLEARKLTPAHVVKHLQAGDGSNDGLDEASAIAMGQAVALTLKHESLIALHMNPQPKDVHYDEGTRL